MGRKPDLKARKFVLDEAEHLLHMKGYHATSMDDVACACRMTKANVIHHFGSKKGLALEVLDSKIADYRERRVNPLCVEADPAAAVRNMFEDARRRFESNGCRAGCFIGNVALEMSDSSEIFRKRVSKFFDDWLSGIAECLKKARHEGLLNSSLDPWATAEAIVSLYEGAIMLARSRRDAGVLSRAGKAAEDFIRRHQNQKRRTKTMGPKTPCGC